MAKRKWQRILGAVLLAVAVVATISLLGDLLVAPGGSGKETPPAEPAAVAPPAEEAPPAAVAVESGNGTSAEGAGEAKTAALAGGGAGRLALLLAAADAEAGRAAAKKCATCHNFVENGPKRVGPDLLDVVGKPRAGGEGYAYSPALARAGGTWGYAELDAFLADPKGSIPGNRMRSPGVKSAEERADLIRFLWSLSDSPPPLP